MNEMLTTVIALSLQNFNNTELAAFNNAIQTFGVVPKENFAYKKSVELNLIKDNGEPFEIEATRDAAAHEVNRRVADGIFN